MNEPNLSQIARTAAEKIDAHISERLDRHTSPQIETIAAIIESVFKSSDLYRSGIEHRCPHFQPKGEDSAGAYNAAIINDATNDLLDPWERERINGTNWYKLRIKDLIQRIANLRVMLASANAAAFTRGYEQAKEGAATVTANILDAKVGKWKRAGIVKARVFEVDSLRAEVTAAIRSLLPAEVK